MRHTVSSYVNACDTRIEVMEGDTFVPVKEYSAEQWVRANRHFGALGAAGKHVRLVSTGLIEHVISEVFGLLEDDHHAGPCPACGPACLTPHGLRDITGRRIIAAHWSGHHEQCHPDGCHEESAPRQLRKRKEN